jgi:hypothetical protein
MNDYDDEESECPYNPSGHHFVKSAYADGRICDECGVAE